MAGGVCVDAPVGVRAELVGSFQYGRAEGECPFLLLVEVVDVEVEVQLLWVLLAGPSGWLVAVYSLAAGQRGAGYQRGGTGNPSYDCSGLMLRAYEAAGIKISRTTFEQVYGGTPVYSASQLKPGDLIFLAGSDGTPTAPGHVGMYLGSNLVLDAPRTGENIQLTHFAGGYWDKEAVAFRRTVPS